MNNYEKYDKICLGICGDFELPDDEQIKLFNEIGFDGFFSGWDENLVKHRELADKLGMLYQSVHAPFMKSAHMWEDTEETLEMRNRLVNCVKETASIDVPIVVIHPFIGFPEEYIPTKNGIDNFKYVVDEAVKQNIKVAFENVEGEEHLAYLMDAFKDCENVGFCWDSGHELCYNRGKDMLAIYGDRLVGTHLNDNLGVSDSDGKIFWTDDLHLLPFDGIHNWEAVAKRLNDCNFDGPLTFELIRKSKPDRHENDKYMAMKVEDYLNEVYVRACKLSVLKKKDKDNR